MQILNSQIDHELSGIEVETEDGRNLLGERNRENANQEILELKAMVSDRDRRISELETLIREDDLTGLLNRRGFHRELKQMLAFSKRYHFSAALVYLDIDDFKHINDQHGHAAGDMVLKTVAARISAIVRSSDTLARIGGDEFIIVLWGLDLSAAIDKSQSIMSTIGSIPMQYCDVPICVSASIGIATFEQDDDVDGLIMRADGDMYRNKARMRAGGHLTPSTEDSATQTRETSRDDVGQ